MIDERITVRFRPEQLDCVIDALMLASACEQEDAKILSGMERVSAQCVADAVARQDNYARLAAWLQHVQEEAE